MSGVARSALAPCATALCAHWIQSMVRRSCALTLAIVECVIYDFVCGKSVSLYYVVLVGRGVLFNFLGVGRHGACRVSVEQETCFCLQSVSINQSIKGRHKATHGPRRSHIPAPPQGGQTLHHKEWLVDAVSSPVSSISILQPGQPQSPGDSRIFWPFCLLLSPTWMFCSI